MCARSLALTALSSTSSGTTFVLARELEFKAEAPAERSQPSRGVFEAQSVCFHRAAIASGEAARLGAESRRLKQVRIADELGEVLRTQERLRGSPFEARLLLRHFGRDVLRDVFELDVLLPGPFIERRSDKIVHGTHARQRMSDQREYIIIFYEFPATDALDFGHRAMLV